MNILILGTTGYVVTDLRTETLKSSLDHQSFILEAAILLALVILDSMLLEF